MESWIAQMCVLTSRRQFLAWLSVLIGGAVFIAVNARYVRNFIEGPFPAQSSTLMNIKDAGAAPNYFVSVASDKVLDTGVQEITTTTENDVETGKYVSAGYYALVIGNHALIVKSANKPVRTVTGELKPFPNDLSSQLFSGSDGQELQSETYPFYLDTNGGFRDAGYWSIAIGCLYLALFAWFGGRAWSRWRDVTKHPVLKRVTKQWGDVLGVSIEAEREFNSAVAYRSGGIFLTNKYVIEKTFFGFNIFRFDDMLWAYKKVTQRRVNFIPTGKSYAAVLIFYGGSKEFASSEAQVPEILAYASNKAPWAIIGYSKELAGILKKHPAEFCQAVEARRRELATARV